jgi:thiamine biosynthesis lipoprotein
MRRPDSPLFCLPITLLLLAAPAASGATEAEAKPAAAGADEAAAPLRIVRVERELMGSQARILAAARGDAEAQAIGAHALAAFGEIERVAALLDPAREGGALASLGANAGKDAVAVEPEVFELLVESKRLAQLSRGAFDPTFAALDGVWSFPGRVPAGTAPTAPGVVPSDEAIDAARALVAYKDLELDPPRKTARLKRAGQKVGLAGLARGYALDRAAKLLTEAGVNDFVLALGGDMVVRGTKAGAPWMVGVQDPRAPGHFAAMPAGAGAVMTTGDYERAFLLEGKRYHHVIDPRTGRPAASVRSATVLAPDGVTADALATAVFVLGPKRGMALVKRLKGVEAVVVTSKNRVLVSKGLRKTLQHRPPTDAP